MENHHSPTVDGLNGAPPWACQTSYPAGPVTKSVVLNETDLPPCGQPGCRAHAEWCVPAGTTPRNEHDPILFCWEHLERFSAFVRECDGLLVHQRLLVACVPAVPQYRELVSFRHSLQVLDLVEEFMDAGSSFRTARGQALRILDRLRDPRKLLR